MKKILVATFIVIALAVTLWAQDVSPVFNKLTLKKNELAGNTYNSIELLNQTGSSAALSPQNSPAILFGGYGYRGDAPTGNQPDQWKIWSNPLLDQSGDTAHLNIYHSYDGTNFDHGLQVTLQDQFLGGETILATPNDPNLCLYPKATPSAAHGVQGFYCINGNQIKFGTALSGGFRILMTTGVGFSPQTDNAIQLGEYDGGAFGWSQVNAYSFRGHKDTVAAGTASANITIKAENNTAATSGNQRHSPAISWSGRGFDTNSSSSRTCEYNVQLVPVQETAAPPSTMLRFTHRISGIDADIVDAYLTSRGSGTWVSQHDSGQGTAPTPTAGSAGNCGSSASVSLSTGSSDKAGTFIITTGSTSCSTGTVATIAFNAAYTTAPHVTISAADSDAAALANPAYVDQASTSTSSFVIVKGTAGLAASTEYRWGYRVTQ